MKFDVPFKDISLKTSKQNVTKDVFDRADYYAYLDQYIESGGTLLDFVESFTEKAALHISETVKPVKTIVLCGPSLNGAMGFALARLLKKYGFEVSVALDTMATEQQSPEYIAEKNAWHGKIYDFTDAKYGSYKLVIDSLYGSDLDFQLSSKDISVIREINKSNKSHVISLDVPSGLDVSTGNHFGEVIHSDMTICAQAERTGFHSHIGPECVGKIIVKEV